MKKFFLIFVLFFLISTYLYAQLANSVYNSSECGLNIIHKAAKIGQRYATPAGSNYPVTFNVNEFPSECYVIEKAYLWWVVSNSLDNPPNPTVEVTNPASSKKTHNVTTTGTAGHKCWGEKDTRGYRADITASISGNGTYRITPSTTVNETDGITMLIIYRDLRANFQGQIGRAHV